MKTERKKPKQGEVHFSRPNRIWKGGEAPGREKALSSCCRCGYGDFSLFSYEN